VINLRHAGLIVHDMDKSYELYRDILGFKPRVDQIEKGDFYEHLTGLKDGIARTSKCYSDDGTCIELIEYKSQRADSRLKELTSEGFNHIALNVDDLDILHEKLNSIGIKFINKPKMNSEKTAKVAFCKDFEGNLLELVQTSF
jgi:catechol 2,3-dioxygenase-like lactoylglutathione lyase family enzyme|tara:strand:+ start:219 stop:647 length:429 start_codon:yes stop_codon:yes gene_type:complete